MKGVPSQACVVGHTSKENTNESGMYLRGRPYGYEGNTWCPKRQKCD